MSDLLQCQAPPLEKGKEGEGGDDKTYFVMKFKAVELAKEVKRSDSWCRFACGDVYIVQDVHFQEMTFKGMLKENVKK